MVELRPVVLVTRACGDLGARVVEMLRRHGGFAVRVMVRAGDDASFAAQGNGDGIESIDSDCDDFESLRGAMEGCWGVVAIVRHASPSMTMLIDAAADAGVGRVALVLDDGGASLGPHGDPAIATYAESAGVGVVTLRDVSSVADTGVESLAGAFFGRR